MFIDTIDNFGCPVEPPSYVECIINTLHDKDVRDCYTFRPFYYNGSWFVMCFNFLDCTVDLLLANRRNHDVVGSLGVDASGLSLDTICPKNLRLYVSRKELERLSGVPHAAMAIR